MQDRGVTPAEAEAQLRFFRTPPPFIVLDRPCAPGDGVTVLSESDLDWYVSRCDAARLEGRLAKFVPASGAASRMFKSLKSFRDRRGGLVRSEAEAAAARGDDEAREAVVFMDGLRRFAFYEALKAALAREGLDADRLAAEGRFTEIVDSLMASRGLGYAGLPKGLMAFHRGAEGPRAAFEEHLLEAADCVRDGAGLCRVHFTVSPEHLDQFKSFAARVAPAYERALGCRFALDFSVQSVSTDTLAADLENRPFRDGEGRLLFRPGGHGSLLKNLGNLGGDVVFIKNIDNVVHDRLKPLAVRWRKALAGILLELQEEIFRRLSFLAARPNDVLGLDDAFRFASGRLFCPVPVEGDASHEDRLNFILSRLDRPLRVCGVIRNTGEPGGGPFWVRERSGYHSLQIVESAEVDPASPDQQAILKSAGYFNPVDLVCGLRDWRGNPFPLEEYIDPEAVFISKKSHEGRDLKALERPGLWNGSMARWNTIFVEVPVETFHPVKTVNDLLREGHQPE